MQVRQLLRPILFDESLTRGLGDEEARVLIDWLVERAEQLAAECPFDAPAKLDAVRRRAKAVARFVALWCHEYRPGAAVQLAASEAFAWPLPVGVPEPAVLMQRILRHEERSVAAWAA